MEPSSNGHRPSGPAGNPYLDAALGEQPREIIEFERNTDPYLRMLPGVSNVLAAADTAGGARLGYRKHPFLAVLSLLVLLIFVGSALLAFVTPVLGH